MGRSKIELGNLLKGIEVSIILFCKVLQQRNFATEPKIIDFRVVAEFPRCNNLPVAIISPLQILGRRKGKYFKR